MKKLGTLLVSLLITATVQAQQPNRKLAAEVRAEFLHAWNGYKKYAWGHDDLKPLSKTYHDWYSQPLLMTPVDALDTMILMGLDDEAAATKQYILDNLSFDKDIEVQNFEITIRLLGGLLTNYQLTGDKRFLNLAEDLGNRLLPVFNSPTGLPYRYVNLKTGKVSKPISNPAETGTLIIEFGTLSKLTGKPIFFEKAKRALVETYNRRSKIGLVGEWINVETGEWTNTDSHISGAIDSYYEYLLKCSLLFGDSDCKRMWNESITAINKYLADEPRGDYEIQLWYGHADMNTGARRATTYGALDAFFPAVLALSGDLKRAKLLQDSSYQDVEVMRVSSRRSLITARKRLRRPVIRCDRRSLSRLITFITTRRMRSTRYMGERLWRDFVKHCRTEDGYAALKNVETKEKSDSMQSFLFAETFKYFYLLFAPPSALDFDRVIFNTEAHPIRKF